MRSKNLHFEGVVLKIQIYYLFLHLSLFGRNEKKTRWLTWFILQFLLQLPAFPCNIHIQDKQCDILL